MITKKILLSMTLAATLFLASTMTAVAEEAQPSATKPGESKSEPAKPGAMTVDQLKELLGMSVYLQGGYGFNFRNPDSGENDLRVFDHRSNNFTLDLAEIQFMKEAAVGGVGYKLKAAAGETAKFIHSLGMGIKQGQVAADTEPFDLTEAYVQYNAPLGNGLKFTFGKFATYHGAEVIEAKDNPNYSRSFLFNYAIPFTHTGISVAYPFSDAITTTLYVVNGWDNADDNNKGKSVGLGFALTPIQEVTTNFNFMYGPEQKDSTSNNRFLFDWIATIKPIKDLSFILNTDYATEQKDPNVNGVNSKWYGAAGIVKYDFNELFGVAVRGEYFKDPDGTRTGTAQSLKEVTFTPEIRLAKGLLLRPEYRHDWSNRESFNTGKDRTQDTISLGVMYTW